MKDKLEIGMYVRTEWGIGQYVKDYINSQNLKYIIVEGCYNRNNQEDWENIFSSSEIIKSSHNVLKLIEVGDLVTLKNQYCEGEVYRVIGEGTEVIKLDCFKDGYMCVDATDIKQILTKEQFKRESYKIGE